MFEYSQVIVSLNVVEKDSGTASSDFFARDLRTIVFSMVAAFLGVRFLGVGVEAFKGSLSIFYN
ncbi:MAG: hypothetical protein LBR92_02390 [Puniceicoccales bacterium]|nr:hypothetical protein [Puniceicoccales bacterium]